MMSMAMLQECLGQFDWPIDEFTFKWVAPLTFFMDLAIKVA